MSSSKTRRIFLTFDVEDFINEPSTKALHAILLLLAKYKLKALFFITGQIAEELASCAEILELLRGHQIGYHSSSHSVRPTIFEYTDVEDYEEARSVSLKRECSHIDPLTGEIQGEGGIRVLRSLFRNDVVEAFRAPDYCWTPPHLEALRDLGIKYDFSSQMSKEPADFRGITFYPYPICHNWTGNYLFRDLLLSLLKRKTTVVNFHDWYFVDAQPWNYFYSNGNPEKLRRVEARKQEETSRMFLAFDLFLRILKVVQDLNLARITPELERSLTSLNIEQLDPKKVCMAMARWYKDNYGYLPTNLCQHFERFFSDS